MKQLLLTLFSLLLAVVTFGQFNFEYSDTLPVIKNGTELEMPWVGGLSYAQFSDFDFDFDGDLDLFVFDRSSDNIRVFLQEEDAGQKFYKLAYNVHNSFPSDVRYRATMVDYDMDGKKDLFCYGIGGIKVYRNVGDAINGLQWALAKDLLYSDNWGSNLNLYVSSADIPAIADVDFDGDIDVLTYHIGGQHLQYHKNMSMENYGIPDSLVYVLRNECWGGFREDVNTNSLFLNDMTPPCAEGNFPDAELPTADVLLNKTKPTEQTPKHAGSTVLALDYDNSGVMDLIIGDVAFPNMNLLINGGTSPNTNSLMTTVDPLFPSNSTPVDVEVFPAAFYVDVDFDGKRDLVVGANAKNVSANESSILFYKNNGTDLLPNFVFDTPAFLQEQMIEHGTGSVPILTDINNDGTVDLFVANFFRHKPGQLKESTIAYYQNTGTSTQPEFTFVDFNFNNINTLNYGLRTIPTFGDLTGDGLKDMILGLENGTLVYFKNNSSLPTISFGAANVNFTDNVGTVISAGQYAAPQLFDMDNDGLLDLIIGKKTGELLYYRNIGTASNASFQLKNSLLGNIDIATVSPDGYPIPHFFRHLDTTYLFLGGNDGKMQFYKDIDDNLNSGNSFELVSAEYLNIRTGAYSSFFVNDIDNDNYLNMFVGQDLGGLHHFEVSPISTAQLNELSTKFDIAVYPNPSTGLLTVSSETASNMSIQLIDVFGKELAHYEVTNHLGNLDLSHLPSGVYMLIIETGKEQIVTKRIVKH